MTMKAIATILCISTAFSYRVGAFAPSQGFIRQRQDAARPSCTVTTTSPISNHRLVPTIGSCPFSDFSGTKLTTLKTIFISFLYFRTLLTLKVSKKSSWVWVVKLAKGKILFCVPTYVTCFSGLWSSPAGTWRLWTSCVVAITACLTSTRCENATDSLNIRVGKTSTHNYTRNIRTFLTSWRTCMDLW